MSRNFFSDSLLNCVRILQQNNVIAYPTESMFGLGCDPSSKEAVDKLLYLKKRNIDKGFILVASDYNQIKMYVNEHALSSVQKQRMCFYWPGPFTCVVPANDWVPYWLTGKFNTIAIRISAHDSIKKLCQMFGKALISTSANISHMPPCLTKKELFQQFGRGFPLLNGKIGNEIKPSRIINIINGKLIRDM